MIKLIVTGVPLGMVHQVSRFGPAAEGRRGRSLQVTLHWFP